MKKNNLIRSCVFVSFILLITLLFNLNAFSKSIELSYSVFVPPMHVMNQEAEAWAKQVEERTQGKVKVTVYPGSTLLKPKMLYEGVIAGTADIGVLPCIYNRGVWPIAVALNYSNVRFPSANVGAHVANDLFKKYRLENEFKKLKILYFFTPDQGSVASNIAIRTVEDAKGIEIKGLSPEMFKLLGAAMVSMPMSEALVSLQKGTIDAAVISNDVLKGMKFADVVKYVCPNLQLGTTAFWIGMNIDKWNSLPPEAQQAIDQINEERIKEVGVAWDEASDEGLEYANSKGVEIISWPIEEEQKLKRVLEPVKTDYIKELDSKGLPGQEIMDTITELTEKYTKQFSN